MNEADRTLRYLEAASRPKPVRRELACPQCGNVEPGGGKPLVKFYACRCGFEYESLAELQTVS